MSNQSSFPSTPKRSSSWKSNLMTRLPIAIGTLILILIYVYSKDNLCNTLKGATFSTADKGMGEHDLMGGFQEPHASFGRDGYFSWSRGDTGTLGAYECKSGKITLNPPDSPFYPPGESQTVQLDPVTGNLLWNGETYKRTSEPVPSPFIPVIGMLITLLVIVGGWGYMSGIRRK